jgi:hypothetical protein
MQLLLGSSHTERNNFESVIQSFEEALTRIRMPHYMGPHLCISYLIGKPPIDYPTTCRQWYRLFQIAGWKFDDLATMIQQRLCDALYAAGRTKDAGESLFKLVNTFDEEVYVSGPITEWVSGEFILQLCRAFDHFRRFHLPMSLRSGEQR